MTDKKRNTILVILLNEPIDSDDGKPVHGKRSMDIREENEYFNNIDKELKVENRLWFQEIFRMDIENLKMFR